jgi:hypothetical protein
MAIDVHDLGDRRNLRFTTTIGGVATDPTAMTFSIIEPDGLVTTYVKGVDAQIEQLSTGVWRVLWTCRKAGRHFAGFYPSGNIVEPEDIGFYVSLSPIFGKALS